MRWAEVPHGVYLGDPSVFGPGEVHAEMFLLEIVLGTVLFAGPVFLAIWHWSTRDVAYFNRIGVSHSTWKTAFTVGLFGPMPVVALAWWLYAIRDVLRTRSRSATI